MSARAIPWAIAPACPLLPPPTTFTLMSNLRCVLVTRSGASAAISRTRRPRYASGSFSLTVIRPSPGCRRTRAIAFLRRPVPRLNVSANLDVPSGIERDDLRLLRDVPVVGPRVDAKSLEHVGAQRVPLQHAPHCVGDRERRVDVLRLLKRPLAQTTRVSRVPRVLLAEQLGAADLDLGGVDHDHVVAGVQVGGERGLVLAAQDLGHTARQAAQNLVRGVDHKPITLQIRGFRRPRLLLTHSSPLEHAPCARPAPSKSLPSMSDPPRGPFSAPTADLALAAPPPAHPRCCGPGLGGTLPPPAPARRNRLAAPPSPSASRAPGRLAARRPSSSWSSRAGPQAAAPPSTSRRHRAWCSHASIALARGRAWPGGRGSGIDTAASAPSIERGSHPAPPRRSARPHRPAAGRSAPRPTAVARFAPQTGSSRPDPRRGRRRRCVPPHTPCGPYRSAPAAPVSAPPPRSAPAIAAASPQTRFRRTRARP